MTTLSDILAAAGGDLTESSKLGAIDIKLRVVPVKFDVTPGDPERVTFAILLDPTVVNDGRNFRHYDWDTEVTLPVHQVQILKED